MRFKPSTSCATVDSPCDKTGSLTCFHCKLVHTSISQCKERIRFSSDVQFGSRPSNSSWCQITKTTQNSALVSIRPSFWATLTASRVLRGRLHPKQRFDSRPSNPRQCCDDGRSTLCISTLVVFLLLKVSPSPSSIFDFVFMQSPHTPARSRVHGHTHPFINSIWKTTVMISGYRNVAPPLTPHRPIYREMMKVVLINAVIFLLIYKRQIPPANASEEKIARALLRHC